MHVHITDSSKLDQSIFRNGKFANFSVFTGLGTTSISTLLLFFILVHRPDVMRKIQQEIDTVIGRERSPRITDKAHMHYTEAATLESFRYYTVLPLGVVHTTTRDVQFRDYFFPKHTLVSRFTLFGHYTMRFGLVSPIMAEIGINL